jgi:hypothetical protein
VRSLILITNLLVFFLYTALKLLTVAMAMLKNFALPKEKIQNKFYVKLIRERTSSSSYTIYYFAFSAVNFAIFTTSFIAS